MNKPETIPLHLFSSFTLDERVAIELAVRDLNWQIKLFFRRDTTASPVLKATQRLAELLSPRASAEAGALLNSAIETALATIEKQTDDLISTLGRGLENIALAIRDQGRQL